MFALVSVKVLILKMFTSWTTTSRFEIYIPAGFPLNTINKIKSTTTTNEFNLRGPLDLIKLK